MSKYCPAEVCTSCSPPMLPEEVEEVQDAAVLFCTVVIGVEACIDL